MARQRKQRTPVHAGRPVKPDYLTTEETAEWDKLMGEIQEAGIQITVAHRSAVELAASIAADIRASKAEIAKEGAYKLRDKGLEVHPAVKRMDALRRDYIKVLSVIGLRPGQVEEPQEGNSLEEALDG